MQPTARVRVNSQLSPFFKISRGTRQGCPLSPLLFMLAMEPFAKSLRTSACYQGVQIGNKHFKLSLFVDDMALYVTKPLCSLQDIDRILDVFQVVSGLHINKDKSIIYPVTIEDSLKATVSQSFQYSWTQCLEIFTCLHSY